MDIDSRNLNFVGTYKNKIITRLTSDELVVKLLNPAEHPYLETYDVLLGGKFYFDEYGHSVIPGQGKEQILQPYVFDYMFVTGTTSDQKTFITVDVVVDTVEYNMFNRFKLILNIFAHKDLVSLNKYSVPTKQEMEQLGHMGNRIDQLCGIVDISINGADVKALGKISPNERGYYSIYCPNDNYYGKQLVYTVTGYNESGDDCGN